MSVLECGMYSAMLQDVSKYAEYIPHSNFFAKVLTCFRNIFLYIAFYKL